MGFNSVASNGFCSSYPSLECNCCKVHYNAFYLEGSGKNTSQVMELLETSEGVEGLESMNGTGNMEGLEDFEVFNFRNFVNVIAFLVMSIGI